MEFFVPKFEDFYRKYNLFKVAKVQKDYTSAP